MMAANIEQFMNFHGNRSNVNKPQVWITKVFPYAQGHFTVRQLYTPKTSTFKLGLTPSFVVLGKEVILLHAQKDEATEQRVRGRTHRLALSGYPVEGEDGVCPPKHWLPPALPG